MNCPNCGIELRADDKVCFVCGTPVAVPPPQPADKNHLYQPQRPAAESVRSSSRADSGTVPREGYSAPTEYNAPGDGFNSYSEIPQNGYPYQEPPKKKNRKPLVISIIALILVAAIVTGAILIINNGKVSEAELREAKKNYLPPAQAVQIDLTKADPSNSQIKFTYDDRARITSCVYSVNNKQYEQSYDYDDRNRSVHITVDYKKNHILTQDISYDKVQKPNEFVVVDDQYLRLDEQSLYPSTPPPTDPPATDAPADAPTEAETVAETEAPTQAPTDDYRDIYLNFLDQNDLSYEYGKLIYLNDDDTPELLLISGSDISTWPTCKDTACRDIYVCWINNGTVSYETAYFCGDEPSSDFHGADKNQYVERAGYMRSNRIYNFGTDWFMFEFDGNTFQKVHSGNSISGKYTDTGEVGYTIDGETVSEEEYSVYSNMDWTDITKDIDKDSLPEYIRTFG